MTYTAPERGYIQVFVANVSDQEVFSDQMVVEHIPQLMVQENHYYPFGLELAGLSKKGKPEHRWKFTGVELMSDFGLQWYDYKYRKNYNSQIGRFFSVDPIAEQYIYLTPYQHASNNPASKIEIEGLEGVFQQLMNLALHNPNTTKRAVEAGTRLTQVLSWKNLKNQGGKVIKGAGKLLGTVGLILTPTNSTNTPEKKWHEQQNRIRQLDFLKDSPDVLDIPSSGTPTEIQSSDDDESVEYFYRAMSAGEFIETGGKLTHKGGQLPFVATNPAYLLDDGSFINKESNKEGYDVIVQYRAKKRNLSETYKKFC